MLETTTVADPDPYVFGPPGSGSISQRSSLISNNRNKLMLETVLRIRIRMFLSLLDPDPDPLVRDRP
jgi:hypothetical protein